MIRAGSTSGGRAPAGSSTTSASGESTGGVTPAADTRSRRGPKIVSLEAAIGGRGARGRTFVLPEDGAATLEGGAGAVAMATGGVGAAAAGAGADVLVRLVGCIGWRSTTSSARAIPAST